MTKSFTTIIIEACVVGLLLIFIYEFIKHNILPENGKLIKMLPDIKPEIIILFVSGAFFHLLCQISGINTWYVNNYYKN